MQSEDENSQMGSDVDEKDSEWDEDDEDSEWEDDDEKDFKNGR